MAKIPPQLNKMLKSKVFRGLGFKVRGSQGSHKAAGLNSRLAWGWEFFNFSIQASVILGVVTVSWGWTRA